MADIDNGLEITFMHIHEIIKDPKMLDNYSKDSIFFPVYLKNKKREALLLGVRPHTIIPG
jgi:hypothetical protein